ncbi:MAG TPA: DUF2325 domain-containing protein [bacterium]|nr:DUF2325 domain-containing protein [bacterium]
MAESIMNTPELRLILHSCFSPTQLRSFFQAVPPGENVYEAAVEAILNESEEGCGLIRLLDQESAPQRKKIQAMKVPELRQGLAFEFLEPGRMLGLVLWSLLRDNRISAHELASQLARKHMQSPAEMMADEMEEGDEAGSEISFGGDEMGGYPGMGGELSGIPFAEEGPPAAAGYEAGALEEQESPGEEPPSLTDARETREAQSFLAGHAMEQTYSVKAQKSKTMRKPNADAGRTVQLGGIDISLASLTRACEKIYEEPIELVTDENLVSQDKLVVVGKHCGIRILVGPQTSPMEETPQPDTGEPVTIDPESLKFALSRIYNDSVELIPDAALLDQGTIAFAGKRTGLFILKNSRVRIPISSLEGAPGKAASAFPPDSGALDAMRKQLSALEGKIADLEKKISISGEPYGAADAMSTWEEEVENLYEETISDRFLAEEETRTTGEPSESPSMEDSLSSEPLEAWEKLLLEPDQDEEDLILEERVEETFREAPPAVSPGSESVQPETKPVLEENAVSPPVPEIKPETPILQEAKPEVKPEPPTPPPGKPVISATLPPDQKDQEEERDIDLENLEDMEDLDMAGLGLEEHEADSDTAGELHSQGEDLLADEEISLEDLNLDDLDLASLGLEEIQEDQESQSPAVKKKPKKEELESEFDLLKELGLTDAGEQKPAKIFRGEQVLLLGGEEKNAAEYQRIVQELGGLCAWYPQLADVPEGEIAQRVDQADVMVTFSSNALTDPGILQAVQYAKENNIPVFEHHSASPLSVQKYLVKLAEEGKIGV